MKLFEIWMEGYIITGNRSDAQKIGEAEGIDFNDAVINYMKLNPDSGISENGRGRYGSEDRYQNRPSNWNIWACNLYDNEADARKSFG